ncbi:FAD-dependent oxidoreductase [Sulfitobacter sp. BDSS02]|nr:FAD-dependent oxidoreductase [Sulfitobacter sp. BDSS02]MBR9847869.1 FAD-binding oxidoreductase [Paracoccaceae bacterium]
MSDIFTTDFKAASYWWDRSPLADDPVPDLPAKADAVVIGAGYTGLHAALRIARGGRSVVVVEAGALGQGCSTKNGGQVSQSIKPGFDALVRKYGKDIAQRILGDGHASRAYVEDFVRTEGIECDFRVSGRFHAAHSDKAFAELEHDAANQPAGLEVPVRIVPRSEQRSELGSDFYHGGAVFEDHAVLDPGRYHAGLLKLVREARAVLVPQTRATGISSDANGATVNTSRGTITCRDVVMATNGYTDAASPWHQRRIIPIGSYIIATEELPEALMDELFPTDRIVSDSRKVVYYYRTSPDRKRILFGGRVSAGETDTTFSAKRLYEDLVRIFPQIEGHKVSHSWMGFVGYTFNQLAHTGQRDRVHHAMGYCGSGVGMASYLGMKTGLRVIGDAGSATGLEHGDFSTRPMYRGKPWFLPAAVEFYRMKDRMGL